MLLVPKGTPSTAGFVSAPVTAMATSPPRTRALNPPNVTSTVARSPGLATRRLASLWDRRSAAPDPCATPPVWSSSSRRHLPELNPQTRRQQRGLLAVDVPEVGVRPADQLPAAGGFAWVDAAELTCQADGADGHLGARLRAPRYVEPFVTADQVGETRCETGETDPPWGRGVRGDDVAATQSGQLRDVVEVGSVVHHVDHHIDLPLDRRAGLEDRIRRQSQLAELLAGRHLIARAVQLDEHRPRGRNDVNGAGQICIAKNVVPGQYLRGAVELEQQRLIAVVGDRADHHRVCRHAHVVKLPASKSAKSPMSGLPEVP